MSTGVRLAIAGVIAVIVMIGAVVYLAQAVQPERETTVEIIPNETFQ
ncbi:MAG: hypothetical protein ACON4J_04790 [Parvibaculales bacterium]